MMKIAVALFALSLGTLSASVLVSVPGTSDPWLAGMPNGSTASLTDSAPAQSPVPVILSLVPGSSLHFSGIGCVSNVPSGCSGNQGDGGSFISHLTGAENGISDVRAPLNSLVGVFLDGNQPSLTGAPSALNFETLGVNFASVSPALKQVFFIGDGHTSSGAAQNFVIPAGTTRLYLGTMDGYEWSNNSGAFRVTVEAVPEPSATILALSGLVLLALRRRTSR